MYTISDIERRKQIFNGFIKKSYENENKEENSDSIDKETDEEKSPVEIEREKEQNKK